MSDFLIAGLDDEDRKKTCPYALYALAQQAINSDSSVTASELDQVRRISSASTRSLQETSHPSLNDGKRQKTAGDFPLLQTFKTRPAPNASIISSDSSIFPELERVMSAAAKTTAIPTFPQSSLFTLSSEKPISPASSVDSDRAERLTDEAINYLEKIKNRAESKELSIDQMAEAFAVPRDEIAEHALLEASERLEKKEGPLHNFPNVAREMLQLGLQMETFKTKELEDYKKQGDEYREKIQSLLKFSALLDKLPPNKDSYNLKEALLEPLSGLEKPFPAPSMEKEEIEQCIKEIFPAGSYVISKEQLSGGKVRVNDIMGEYKTKMTNLLTTEISIVIHNLQMVTQMMQEISKKQHQLVSSIVSHYTGR